jgi:gamma-glutamyltranspeptidase/glutathione hydrolase
MLPGRAKAVIPVSLLPYSTVTRMANLSILRRTAPLAAALLLAGCGLSNELVGGGGNARLGEPKPQAPVAGFVVTPVPEASVAAHEILQKGGNAVDAAVAAGFALGVTLPSRAGLGGGAVCLIDMPHDEGGTGRPVALLFPPGTPRGSQAGAARPAAVPQMARGLLAMQARYGALPLATDMAPAATMAGGGVPVSRALAADLGVVGDALLADPAARNVFASPAGQLLQAGETLRQPDLAATLARLQSGGVLSFYQGHLADSLLAGAAEAGAGLTATDLRADAARYATPDIVHALGADIALPPTAAGMGTRAAIEALASAPDDLAGAGRDALAAAAAARHVTGFGALPASAGYAIADAKGGVVGCATTMNNLFGTGRIATGTGILLAASPKRVSPPLLSVALATTDGAFRAVTTGAGQAGAPLAAGAAMAESLRAGQAMPHPVPAPGRANAIACSGTLPGAPKSCAAVADPRGAGLAIGSR